MLREKPKRKLALQIAPNAVTADKIAPYAVTPDKLHPDTIKIWDDIAKGAEMGGVALLQDFGNSIYFGISQKVLTEAFNKIWAKIEDITGESLLGFQMAVTPEYYIGEEGSNIHVSATTVDTVGVFEYIGFYINGQLIKEEENVDYMEFDTEINETSVVMCVAKILGVEYQKQAIITHYSSFWLGAGSTYTDVMKNSNLRPVANGMRGAYNIGLTSGQKIIIVLGTSLREGFIRADINGVEIAFVETTQTVDGNTYKVLTSENTYQAGTYNIDING